jgi:GH24 family phage-related lysozyme (muramidase)
VTQKNKFNMTYNKKKIATGVLITAIVIIMLRKNLATALNSTPFSSISDKLFNLISRFEGFIAVPVWDYMQYSVGYGSGYNWDQGRPVNKTDIIDKETARRWLLTEAQDKYNFVRSLVRVPISDNQLLALSSFAYNIGEGAFAGSTLLKLLNNGTNKETVARQFDLWVNAGGKVNSGLKGRRSLEKSLFLS